MEPGRAVPAGTVELEAEDWGSHNLVGYCSNLLAEVGARGCKGDSWNLNIENWSTSVEVEDTENGDGAAELAVGEDTMRKLLRRLRVTWPSAGQDSLPAMRRRTIDPR